MGDIAQKLKAVHQVYSETTKRGGDIQNLIASEDSWVFAKNEQMGGKLQQLQDSVENACTPDMRTLLTSELPQLRRSHSLAQLRGHLRSVEDLEEKVSAWGKLLQQLEALHAALHPCIG